MTNSASISDAKFQRSEQKNIFPAPLVDKISEIPVKWHKQMIYSLLAGCKTP